MIMNNHDFSGHIWEFEEDTIELTLELDDKEGEDDEVTQSEKVTENGEEAETDEDFQTPKQSRDSDSSARKGKKRLLDRGMEKMKHKVLSARPQQAPLGEDMKTWMAQLFQQNIEAMEDRLQKQMAERFEKMQSELKGHLSLSDGVYMDFDAEIGTQGVEGLCQASFVPGFDPSQTNREDGTRDFWTPLTSLRSPVTVAKEGSSAPPPTRWEKWYKGGVKTLQLSDSPLPQDASPESLLYYVAEDTWTRFSEWSMNPKTLRIGPTAFNMTIATRIIAAGKWLGNEEMDAFMYMWREKTSLRRWNVDRIAFMTATFCLQIDTAYRKFTCNKRSISCPIFFLLTIEESFQLMGGLTKLGVLMLIKCTSHCL
ncbi:unnamed protein product [Eruca vesicaria subsp. sativa]|uniref:Uncharacterized protein n=1 Tax=Eruca vesicaria subsp. sativa TaxID=29727 RepID=A0ABC8L5R9_ERUVS|nr:unnamed protein product [Eruca vesicaria subsp. sativa]